jgi:hypothetical protein
MGLTASMGWIALAVAGIVALIAVLDALIVT